MNDTDKKKEKVQDAWDMIEQKEYAAFDVEKDNTLILTFIENNFTPKKNPQFGNIQYEFQVIEVSEPGTIKTFSPSSNRLMVQLKEHIPLEGKTFKMVRIGEGFKTDYTLEKIEISEQTEIL